MTNDLYFLPLIAQACHRRQPKRALEAAFRKIEEMGGRPEYRRGYGQFLRFMDRVRTCRLETDAASVAEDLAHEIASEAFGGNESERLAALDLLASRKAWQTLYEQILSAEEEMRESIPLPQLHLEREGKRIETVPLGPAAAHVFIRSVLPGHYALKLDTGRIVWEANLTDRELTWAMAFPQKPMKLAADTEQETPPATVEASLLDGDILLRVHPGIENGRIEIETQAVTID